MLSRDEMVEGEGDFASMCNGLHVLIFGNSLFVDFNSLLAISKVHIGTCRVCTVHYGPDNIVVTWVNRLDWHSDSVIFQYGDPDLVAGVRALVDGLLDEYFR